MRKFIAAEYSAALVSLVSFCAVSGANADEYIDLSEIRKQQSAALCEMCENSDVVSLSALQPSLEKERKVKLEYVRASEEKISPDRIYKKCRDSIVAVCRIYKCHKCDEWHSSNASGFAIRRDGVIVTNYHVIESDSTRTNKSDAVAVWTQQGKMLPIKDILASSKENDLAILKVDAEFSPLSIADDIDVGSSVYCISHPAEHFYAITEGIVAGKFLTRERKDLAVTCDYARGSSGAPIVDDTGSVVGVVRATSSIYIKSEDKHEAKLQMVWKFCIPSECLLDVIGNGK